MALFGAKPGKFGGIPSLAPFAGVAGLHPPHWAHLEHSIATMNTTATRLYYIPIYFEDIRAYTGIKSYNHGAGDNGDTFRMGVYQATLTSSGNRSSPSSLVADCGEVTLTGAAAERTLASAFTPAYVGWHYLAFHANQAANMRMMTNTTSVGADGQYHPGLKYHFGATAVTNDYNAIGIAAFYVDTTYGALASTAVAPTGFVTQAPTCVPYLT